MGRILHTRCHGCDSPMEFEAVPVKTVEITGAVKVSYGKEGSIWICKTCRLEPKKLKAARIAAGMPAVPERSSFDDDDYPEELEYMREVV